MYRLNCNSSRFGETDLTKFRHAEKEKPGLAGFSLFLVAFCQTL